LDSSAEADVSTLDEVNAHRKDAVELAAQISKMGVSGSPLVTDPTTGSAESSIPESGSLGIDKKLRALKKKVLFAYVPLLHKIMQYDLFQVLVFLFSFSYLLDMKRWQIPWPLILYQSD
jgi:hypothetical protein